MNPINAMIPLKTRLALQASNRQLPALPAPPDQLVPRAGETDALTRRAVAALMGLPVLMGLPALGASPAQAQGAVAAPGQRLRTPGQVEGPFYPVRLPRDADFDLLRHDGRHYLRGQPTWLLGQVTDLEGGPVKGAVVEIWQCDHAGHYDHPGDGSRMDPAFQGFGRVSVDATGTYRFRTIRPVAYGGRTPHIHVKVKLGRRELLTTQLYVAGEPLNQRDFLWRGLLDDAARAALTVPFTPAGEGMMQARLGLVVAV